MKVRKAQEKDISYLKKLRLQLYTKWHKMDPADKIDKKWFSSIQHTKVLKKYIKDAKTLLLIIEHKEETNGQEKKKVIGYNLACIKQRNLFQKRPIGIIEETFVLPKHQGKGLGKEFFEKTKEWFKKKKVIWSFVSTHSLDKQANLFWKKRGYEEFNITYKMKL